MNGYRKHCNETIGNLARHLVAKWKQVVQLTTEAVSDTHCAQAACDNLLITADTEEKVSVRNYGSQVDEQHLGTSSSKRKHVHASGNKAASKCHSSTTVKYKKIDEKDGDKIFRNPSLQTEVSVASLPRPLCNDQCRDYSNCSQNQSATQMSAYTSASTGHQKSLVGDLPFVKNAAGTSDRCQREKHSKLSRSTAEDRNKEKCHSDSKVSAKISKSASREKKSHNTLRDGHVKTDLSKSVGKNASKTRCKGSEKKSPNIHLSVIHMDSNASVPSSAKTHISKDRNEADVKTFTSTDDVDDSECNGMTFEQMLNYDNHGSAARKKKGSVRRSGKCSEVPKSTSNSTSVVSSSVTKHSSKPDSLHTSKHTSCLLPSLDNSISVESGRSHLSQPPVIPHPDSQVGTDFL